MGLKTHCQNNSQIIAPQQTIHVPHEAQISVVCRSASFLFGIASLEFFDLFS